MIVDNHGRPLTYLRLSVTDRCNLRCFYCMPEESVDFVPRKELLSYEEMFRLSSILVGMGIRKIRITGGEPFLRKDLMHFLKDLRSLNDLEELHITSNGILMGKHIEELAQLPISGINLSLDTLDREKFKSITKRDNFEKVIETFHALLSKNIPVKVNAVVMEGVNTDDIIPLASLAEEYPVEIRFIEEMPFSGGGRKPGLNWDYKKIESELKSHWKDLEPQRTQSPQSTALEYSQVDWPGSVGVIPAFSRTFCGTCNRIRITPQGQLKTCLYDKGVWSVRDFMRENVSDDKIKAQFLKVFGERKANGFEAEEFSGEMVEHESMSSIGG